MLVRLRSAEKPCASRITSFITLAGEVYPVISTSGSTTFVLSMIKAVENHLIWFELPFDRESVNFLVQFLSCKNILMSKNVHLLLPFLIKCVRLATWLLGLIICDSLNPLQVSKAFPDDLRGSLVWVHSFTNISVFHFPLVLSLIFLC